MKGGTIRLGNMMIQGIKKKILSGVCAVESLRVLHGDASRGNVGCRGKGPIFAVVSLSAIAQTQPTLVSQLESYKSN